MAQHGEETSSNPEIPNYSFLYLRSVSTSLPQAAAHQKQIRRCRDEDATSSPDNMSKSSAYLIVTGMRRFSPHYAAEEVHGLR